MLFKKFLHINFMDKNLQNDISQYLLRIHSFEDERYNFLTNSIIPIQDQLDELYKLEASVKNDSERVLVLKAISKALFNMCRLYHEMFMKETNVFMNKED